MHAVTSVLQGIFQKLEHKILQQVRQDLFFCGREESERRERESGECCRGHRSSAAGDKLSTRAVKDERTHGRTDGRTDGWMDG